MMRFGSRKQSGLKKCELAVTALVIKRTQSIVVMLIEATGDDAVFVKDVFNDAVWRAIEPA